MLEADALVTAEPAAVLDTLADFCAEQGDPPGHAGRDLLLLLGERRRCPPDTIWSECAGVIRSDPALFGYLSRLVGLRLRLRRDAFSTVRERIGDAFLRVLAGPSPWVHYARPWGDSLLLPEPLCWELFAELECGNQGSALDWFDDAEFGGFIDQNQGFMAATRMWLGVEDVAARRLWTTLPTAIAAVPCVLLPDGHPIIALARQAVSSRPQLPRVQAEADPVAWVLPGRDLWEEVAQCGAIERSELSGGRDHLVVHAPLVWWRLAAPEAETLGLAVVAWLTARADRWWQLAVPASSAAHRSMMLAERPCALRLGAGRLWIHEHLLSGILIEAGVLPPLPWPIPQQGLYRWVDLLALGWESFSFPVVASEDGVLIGLPTDLGTPVDAPGAVGPAAGADMSTLRMTGPWPWE